MAGLVEGHILTFKHVNDGQAARGRARVWMALWSAAGHTQMIADPLAAAITRQFLEKFASLETPTPETVSAPGNRGALPFSACTKARGRPLVFKEDARLL